MRKEMFEERPIMNVEEVARYLSIGKTKCWELIWSSSIPSFRLNGGKLVRVRRSELLKTIEAWEADKNGGKNV